nr:universal stress protein [Natronomonas marina]
MSDAGAPNGDAAADPAPSGADAGGTVMVALSNPRTERALVTLAAALAEARDGTVLAAHVVQVPDQTALEAAAENERLLAESERLLADARADAEAYGVAVETKTVLSHRGLEEVFDAARTYDADALVMGYGGARLAGGRAEGALEELTHDLPCDVLVLNGRTFDPSKVLVPTAGGYSSDLSAEVARALRDVAGAAVSVLYVAGEDETDARAFVESWAAEHGLADAEILLETGDVEASIERAAGDATLVVVGATERGLLSRIVRGSLAFSVLEELETPVLLAERPSDRSLLERLFARR